MPATHTHTYTHTTKFLTPHHGERVQNEEARVSTDAGVADSAPDVVRQPAVHDALAEPQRAPDEQEERPVDVADRLLGVYPAAEDENRAGREGRLDLCRARGARLVRVTNTWSGERLSIFRSACT